MKASNDLCSEKNWLNMTDYGKPWKRKAFPNTPYIQHSISIAHNLIAYAITKTYRSIRLINCAIFYIVGLRTSWSISMMTILFDRHPGNGCLFHFWRHWHYAVWISAVSDYEAFRNRPHTTPTLDGMGRFLFLPDAMWGAESPLYSLINLLTQGRIRFLIAKQFIPVRFILLLKRQELVG